MGLVDTVRLTIEGHRMLREEERILVGVSGGPDSFALLGVLVALRKELKISLRAAYVNHGLRPLAARREEAFVRKIGRLWNVPVTILRCQVKKSSGDSWEASAREARYQALTASARRNRCQAIALGHTQDDQAETVLMWILRGTGTTGLAGIPPLREIPLPGRRKLRIIRPLIDCSRRQVEGYVKSLGIQAMKDQTNLSPRYLRNRIRRSLIPLLERNYNPRLRFHLAQLAQILREDVDWLKAELKERFHEFVRVKPLQVRLDRLLLKKAPAGLRKGILRFSVETLQADTSGFSLRHWSALDRLLTDGSFGSLDLPHGFRAQTRGKRWVFLSLSSRSGRLKEERRRENANLRRRR